MFYLLFFIGISHLHHPEQKGVSRIKICTFFSLKIIVIIMIIISLTEKGAPEEDLSGGKCARSVKRSKLILPFYAENCQNDKPVI